MCFSSQTCVFWSHINPYEIRKSRMSKLSHPRTYTPSPASLQLVRADSELNRHRITLHLENSFILFALLLHVGQKAHTTSKSINKNVFWDLNMQKSPRNERLNSHKVPLLSSSVSCMVHFCWWCFKQLALTHVFMHGFCYAFNWVRD